MTLAPTPGCSDTECGKLLGTPTLCITDSDIPVASYSQHHRDLSLYRMTTGLSRQPMQRNLKAQNGRTEGGRGRGVSLSLSLYILLLGLDHINELEEETN
jgi:hypothetical protein